MLKRLKKLFGFSEQKVVSKDKTPDKYIHVIKSYQDSITKGGARSIKLSILLKHFGFKKIGSRNLIEIEEILKDNNLYCYPTITSNITRNTRLTIYNYPARSLGNLFSKESDFEDYVVANESYKDFGIVNAARQESPDGTKDKFDFLGYDKNGKEVVLELKHKGGGKRAVEQVLRYAGILKKANNEKIRKILVTGIVELSLSEAIFGMETNERKYFEWYVYYWNKKKDTIKFERITNKYIDDEITKLRKMKI